MTGLTKLSSLLGQSPGAVSGRRQTVKKELGTRILIVNKRLSGLETKHGM